MQVLLLLLPQRLSMSVRGCSGRWKVERRRREYETTQSAVSTRKCLTRIERRTGVEKAPHRAVKVVSRLGRGTSGAKWRTPKTPTRLYPKWTCTNHPGPCLFARIPGAFGEILPRSVRILLDGSEPRCLCAAGLVERKTRCVYFEKNIQSSMK